MISIYAAQGFTRFHPLTGYLGEMVADFVEDTSWPGGVEVECLDTGLDTPTGARVLAAREAAGDDTFCVTYADGVADIDLSALLGFHAGHGRTGTMTTVRPNLQWGVVEIGDGEAVTGFQEKPRSESWINGGFFCFEPEVFGRLTDDSVLERAPLEGLAADDQLRAFRHHGFWDCMDTYKDLVTLNDLWERGAAPWLRPVRPGDSVGPLTRPRASADGNEPDIETALFEDNR